MAQFELCKISNRVRFILAVISGEVVISNRRKAAIEGDLQAQGYDRMPNTKKVCMPSCCRLLWICLPAEPCERTRGQSHLVADQRWQTLQNPVTRQPGLPWLNRELSGAMLPSLVRLRPLTAYVRGRGSCRLLSQSRAGRARTRRQCLPLQRPTTTCWPCPCPA